MATLITLFKHDKEVGCFVNDAGAPSELVRPNYNGTEDVYYSIFISPDWSEARYRYSHTRIGRGRNGKDKLYADKKE